MKREILKKILKKYFKKIEKINKICIDSREVMENDLFFAIRGGNNYIKEALNKGAYVIYDKNGENIVNEKCYKVKDSIEFLQNLAKEYREKLNIKIIAVTGSNGKTTTKDIIFQIFNEKFKTKKTIGNKNNHIGMPYTLLNVEDDDEFLILEFGMSNLGEIDLLASISKPDIGVITNIGESHLEYLKTKENVFKAKSEIIPYSKKMVVNGDDFYLSKLNDKKIIKIGRNGNISILEIEIKNEYTYFKLKINDKEHKFITNLYGVHNVYNIVIAIQIAIFYEMRIEKIKDIIKNLTLTSMRFEVLKIKGNIYINDAYNASPISMKASLETFNNLYNDRYKIVVLGDMLELGINSKKYHEDLSYILERIDIKEIYLYGKEMQYLYKKIKNRLNVRYFTNKKDIQNLLGNKEEKLAVLLKGSRGMKLEEIL
ncbi:UDP-N-acetylmuramoyl-tripeptide--D-alanyl-D-alanine ligase [Hypnocyclicus thermotrophus]|uniref:UDP-N-acetylmuramoyl-tripeptide--D-alanyl-D-alanine ligase n=1 Tax=Hypnocyclicus thermotrophus TaxID=1627895 RepID=A0AA46I5G3_9FUSO|nr:UDP-N-acetylmuramoyl-tripeptide--D-alanyl-D-alanine ligase [Hypnocyclicus thermotrophus]TDT69854.1 UDP-N-acetylmuramoyl-tripeptide--D-alanyl-D-alanine ligase [Hypnocyclicus thermotrophus]